jgi:hypothetical protein
MSKENTDMNKVEKGNRYYELLVIWRGGLAQTVNGYLNMGKALHFWKSEKLWRYDLQGTGILSFSSWVKHVLHISPSQAYRLEQIYREVGAVLEKNSIPIDISKVTLLLPHLEGKTDEEKKEMLEDASVCNVEDIKNNIKDMTGNGTPTDMCEHLNTEQITRCKDCGKWLR